MILKPIIDIILCEKIFGVTDVYIKKSEIFGKNLKLLREQKGITQQVMADMINTSRSCISNYESGNREPDNETIRILADFLDVSVDYLFGRSEVKNTIKSNKELNELKSLLEQSALRTALDVSEATPHVKCAVVMFYAYLLEKEKKKA